MKARATNERLTLKVCASLVFEILVIVNILWLIDFQYHSSFVHSSTYLSLSLFRSLARSLARSSFNSLKTSVVVISRSYYLKACLPFKLSSSKRHLSWKEKYIWKWINFFIVDLNNHHHHQYHHQHQHNKFDKFMHLMQRAHSCTCLLDKPCRV